MSQRPVIAQTVFAPLGAVLIWSGNTLVTKAAAVTIDPASIAFDRWMLAFLVLLPFVGRSVWAQRKVVRRHVAQLAVLGALGMAIYQGLAYEAARTTSATNMGVILGLMPLISALLASVFAAEALITHRLIGAAVSLAGLVVITTHGSPLALLHGTAAVGDGLMLVAISANALYGVLLRRWAIPLSTWQQLLVQAGFGTLVLLPFFLTGPMTPGTPGDVPLILYAAIPASVGAPFLWMTGVRRLGAARATLFMNLLPPMVAVGAWATLGEDLHVYHAVGGAVALAGVAIGLRRL